jgi:hypothetical protein
MGVGEDFNGISIKLTFQKVRLFLKISLRTFPEYPQFMKRCCLYYSEVPLNKSAMCYICILENFEHFMVCLVNLVCSSEVSCPLR